MNFRRSNQDILPKSATLLVDTGTDTIHKKRYGESSTVSESYLKNSIGKNNKVASQIFGIDENIEESRNTTFKIFKKPLLTDQEEKNQQEQISTSNTSINW